MNTSAVNVAVVDGKTITQTSELPTGKSVKPIRIKAVENGKYILAEGEKGVAPENITVKRVGKDLHIALEGTDPDQPQLIIEGFFDTQSQLVGVGEDGEYHEYISSDAQQDLSAAFLIEDVAAPQVLGSESLVGFGDGLVAGAGIGWFWPTLLGLAGLGLVGAAIAAKNDDDNDHDHGPAPIVTGPETPTLESVMDNVGDKTGPIENGGVTDDATPTFSGDGTPGNTIIVRDGDKIIGEVIVGEDGKWEFTPETPMGDGSHVITIIEKDPKGNESSPTEEFELIIDLTAPAKSVITDAQDDVGDQQGLVAQNGVTDDSTPTLNGTAEPGATVEVYANGVKIGETLAAADGSWSFTPNPALADGQYSFTTVAVDAAGNRGLPSDPYVLTIKTGFEGTNGGIDSVIDDVGPVQGTIENGGSTDDTKPTLGGGGQTPGDKVTIIDNGVIIGEVIVDEGGNWTFEPKEDLAEGSHEFTVIVTDPSGNSSEPSDPYTVIVDLTPPAQAAITSVVDDQGAVTGPISAGDTTDDAQPQINGTAEAGSTVIIYDNGVEIGRAPVDADGNWSFTPDRPLSNGTHQLTVVAVDAAGNAGEPSPGFDFDIATGGVAPAPAITGVLDDVGSKTGNLMPGSVTDDARPTISGTGQAGSTISVYANGVLLGTTLVGDNGQWSFTPTADLADGLTDFTATATDASGTVSPQTGDYSLTIDTTAPDASNGEVIDDVGAITGPIESGGTTDDSTPTFGGDAEPGSTVIIYDKDEEIGRVPVDDSGKWTFTPKEPLPDGEHSFQTEIEDEAGNRSEKSDPIDFIIDTNEVLISITHATETPSQVNARGLSGDYSPVANGGITSDATPTLNGKATPNATVRLYDNGKFLGSVMSDASGNWTFTPEVDLPEGLHNFTATVETAANGESDPTSVFALEIDVTAPVKPGTDGHGGIDNVNDDVGYIQGPIENGGSTDDSTPTLSGGGQQPGDKITIIDNGQIIGEVPVKPDGTWSFTPYPPLNDGLHEFTVIVTDPAGNASEPSDPYAVNIDTVAPGLPVITSVIDDQGNVQGPINSGDITDDAQPQINGTAEAGSTVIIYDNGVEIGRAPVDADGNWSFIPEPPLSNGSHQLTVAAIDAAGNLGGISAGFDLDVVAGGTPNAPAITGIHDDVGAHQGNLMPGSVTDDARPTVNGTGQAGSTISVYANGVLLGTTLVGTDGRWSFTPETDLAEGLNNISATATDLAGNISPQTGDYPLTIDTTAPGAATGEDLTDDVGAIQGPIESGDTTDDNTPTFNGKAEPGTTVIIYDKGKEIGRAPVNADGDWSFTPSEPLKDGKHSFHTVVEDKAGNQSEASEAIDFTVDTRGVEISITSVVDDEGSVQGPLTNGSVTDDTTPTLNGKATPGGTVNIYDNGVLIGSTTANAAGVWTFTASPALAEGKHSFTATVVTEAGGESAPTSEFKLEIDTTAPGTPGEGDNGGIDDVYDDVGDIQGPIENGGSTDDTTPTLNGGGQEPGDKVTIIDNGKVIGEVIVDEDGTWTFTPETPLNDGEHEFTVIVTDPAGNSSEESDPYLVIVDTVAPGQPVITSVVDDQGNVQGPINSGDVTDDAQLDISGTAEAGSTVIIYDNGVEIGRAPVDADGNWSFTPERPLTNGTHELTVVATDAAGNKSPSSDGFDFELIAGGTPPAPAITGIHDDVGTHQGNLMPGSVTDDARPTVNGTGQAGSTISVYANGVLLGTTLVGADGRWNFTPETDLAEGLNNISATATDLAGNISPSTGDYPLTIDTTAPDAATGEDLSDDVGAIQGPIESGDTTDDNTPTFNGKAEPNTTVIIYDNGVEIGRAPVNADGDWSFTPSEPLKDGEHSFHTVVEDKAGNQSEASEAIDFIVDTRAVEISITSVVDDEGSVTGPLTNGGVTDDTTPTLNGKATPGATVKIYDNGVLIGSTTANAAGDWTFTSEALPEGQHSFTATVVTEAGGESAPTAEFKLEIDTTAPGTPGEGINGGIDNVYDDVGDIQGPIENGGSTDDTTPTLSGGGQEPGSKVTIIDNGKVIGEVPVNPDGTWTFTPETPLNDGEHEFTLIVTDEAGNASEESDPYLVIVDTVAPGQPVITSVVDDQGNLTGPIASGDVTDDAQLDISGTAEAGSTVIIYDNGVEIGRAPVDAEGNWTFTPSRPLTNGAHELTVIATDAAGNKSESSDGFDFELVAGGTPPAPAITGIHDDVGNQTGNLMPGSVTDDARPTVNGTGQAGSTISVYANGVLLGTTLVGADGRWNFTPETDLAEGLNNISATATDLAGNISPSTGDYPLTIDTTAPGIATGEDLTDDVGAIQGPIESGDTTDDNTPTFNGKAEPNTTVIIYDNGVEIGRAPVNADGDWSFTPSEPLKDGEHSFHTVVEDKAGNQSEASEAIDFIVDTRAVEISITSVVDDEGSVTGPLTNGGVTDDTTPTLNGKATPGATVKIYDNGVLIGSTTANAAGVWTFTSEVLPEGNHSFTATVVTEAGGESAPTAEFKLEIDTTAPGTPGEGSNGGIDNVYDDVGDIQGPIENGGSTDDTTPTLSGGGQEPGSKVTIIDNGKVIGEVPVNPDGTWTFTPETPLNDGEHEFTLIVTDEAGNASEESDPYLVIVDTVAPGQPVITSVIDDQGTVKGPINPGDVTDDAQPQINGTAEAGSTVIIYDKGVEIGRAPVDGQGNWTFTPSRPLALGGHELTVVAVDKAGNQGQASDEFDFDVMTGGVPPAPAITDIHDDVGIHQGNLMPGSVTDDARPTINGTAQAGSIIHVYSNGELLGQTKADANGKWSFTPETDLADGMHNISATATNGAGNVGPETGGYPINVDTSAPSATTDDLLTDDVGTTQGPINSGDITDDATPTFSGKAEPGTTVIIYDNGVEIARVPVKQNGDWSYTPKTALPDGPHSFHNVVEDAAGNRSEPSEAIDFVVETITLEISITDVVDDVGSVTGPLSNGGVTDDTTPTLNGRATPGLLVNIYDNGVLLGSTRADAAGVWTFTPGALPEGDHSFTATVVSDLGNESAPTGEFKLEIDTTAPTAQAEIVSMGKDSGNDHGDFITNNGSAGRLIQGSLTAALAADEKVQVSVDGGKTWQDAVVNGDGSWSFVDETAHAANWEIQTRVVDAAGNIGLENSQSVELDSQAPKSPAFTVEADAVTVAFDGAELEVGARVLIKVGNQQYQHELTGSEIAAGKAVVPVEGASYQNVSVGIVDSADNFSGYMKLHNGFDDFNSYSPSGSVKSFTNGELTLTALEGSVFTYTYNSRKSLETSREAVIAITFPGPIQSLSFKTHNVDTENNTATIKDVDGNIIDVLSVPFTGSSGVGSFSYTAPPGVLVGSVVLDVKEIGQFSSGYGIDNISYSYYEVTPVGYVIDSAGSYYGDDEGHAFTLMDASLLGESEVKVIGGAGIDTLVVAGSDQNLDLSSIAKGTLSSIEVIDLTGTGDNTLKLSLEDVLNNGETDLFHKSGSTQMMIKGDAGDVVDLQGLISAEDPGSWATQGSVTIGGVAYEVYTHSSLDAELLVQQGVTTNLV